MKFALKAHPSDNVAVLTDAVAKGEQFGLEDALCIAKQDMKLGQKIAVNHLRAEEPILRYGFTIGCAKNDIPQGELINGMNMKVHSVKEMNCATPKPVATAYFNGFRRPWGTVGIRNEVWVLSLTGCVNDTADKIAADGQQYRTESIDAIVSLTHPYGCSQMNEDIDSLKQILKRILRHGNAAAVLVVGLACASLSPDVFCDCLEPEDMDRIRVLDCQTVDDEIATGLSYLKELCALADTYRRERIPLQELIIGVKCGASDAWSPITSNPVIGLAADKLIAQGGSALLTELSEMNGALEFLSNRCKDPAAKQKLCNMMERYASNAAASPLTEMDTIKGVDSVEERQLAFLQKGGRGEIVDVLSYGEAVQNKGLNLLQAPGYDMVAVSAMAKSGAHMVLFSTGRGTPLGTFVPTLKIANSSDLYERKKEWIDFNAGSRADGESLEDVSDKLFHLILAVANGEYKARNEVQNFRNLTVWNEGVTL